MKNLRQYYGLAEQEAQEQLGVKELIENTAVAVRHLQLMSFSFQLSVSFPFPFISKLGVT